MKTSDVEKEIAARSGTAARNPLGESLVQQNAKGIAHNVGWIETAIGMTEGARQSDPFKPAGEKSHSSVAFDRVDEEEEGNGRSLATDSSRSFGVCCGNLGGVKAHNAAHRRSQVV